MQIEKIPIAKLIHDPTNARKHDKKNIEAVKGSLAKFGQQKPIVIDKNNVVIAGNGTLDAASALDWPTIDCVRTKLTGAEAIAFALADNRTAELAEWDRDILGDQLKSLKDDDWDINEFGFDETDFGMFASGLSGDGKIEDDDVPELKNDNEFDVAPGQIWQLGEHRLMCGDSTVKSDVDALMNGAKAGICFTSPPYSDMRDYGGGDLSISNLKKFFIAHVSDVWFVNLGLQRKDNVIVRYWDEYINYAESLGLHLRSWLVWDKGEAGSLANQQAVFPHHHEWLFMFANERPELKKTVPTKHAGTFATQTVREKNGSTTSRKGGAVGNLKTQGTVLNLSPVKGKTFDHPAMFPVELPEKIIEIVDCETVYEPFCGSGSTLIACEKTGRKCFGMEIDPHYCSVVIKRWQEFTGNDAKKIS